MHMYTLGPTIQNSAYNSHRKEIMPDQREGTHRTLHSAKLVFLAGPTQSVCPDLPLAYYSFEQMDANILRSCSDWPLANYSLEQINRTILKPYR